MKNNKNLLTLAGIALVSCLLLSAYYNYGLSQSKGKTQHTARLGSGTQGKRDSLLLEGSSPTFKFDGAGTITISLGSKSIKVAKDDWRVWYTYKHNVTNKTYFVDDKADSPSSGTPKDYVNDDNLQNHYIMSLTPASGNIALIGNGDIRHGTVNSPISQRIDNLKGPADTATQFVTIKINSTDFNFVSK